MDVPNVVMDCFGFVSHDPDTTRKRSRVCWPTYYGGHRALQERLGANGWVTFVADDSWRAARGFRGADRHWGRHFRPPDSLRASVSLPARGRRVGHGDPRGLTLIVGGGYHGKSTLLERSPAASTPTCQAMAELVATDPRAPRRCVPPTGEL